MHGCSGGACVVLFGGCAWFYLGRVHGFIQGVCVVLFGGVHGFIQGGMHGFIWGGMRGFFSFSGYNEIRSMSGRYASYCNAFLSERPMSYPKAGNSSLDTKLPRFGLHRTLPF